ncbi:hypothetical protein [Yoonia litorea]|nr:hypothetical protein [Yoonia litorea]
MRPILVIALLTACTPFPELAGTISPEARDAPYPTLTPLPDLSIAAPDETDALQARVAALQARAARIRQIDIAALQ